MYPLKGLATFEQLSPQEKDQNPIIDQVTAYSISSDIVSMKISGLYQCPKIVRSLILLYWTDLYYAHDWLLSSQSNLGRAFSSAIPWDEANMVKLRDLFHYHVPKLSSPWQELYLIDLIELINRFSPKIK